MLFVALNLNSSQQHVYSDGWNKKSTLVTTERVEFPGIILEPGNYTIKLEEASSRRNIVQVLAGDGKLLARLIAVPDYRTHEGDAVFTYHQIRASGPKVIRSWYYPGDLNGLEFVYPIERAKEIARATETHVMASNAKDAKNSAIIAVTPTGVEVVIEEAPGAQVARKPRD
jgi:hypothetical protein